MEKNKYLPYSYLALSVVVLFSLMIFGTSQIISFFKTGADKSNSLLVSASEISSNYQPKIRWDYDQEFVGRTMEKGTMEKIITDYISSEYYQYQSLQTGNNNGLNDYFTEKSRDYLSSLSQHYQSLNQSVHSTGIEHFISLKFYSEDGTIATFEDQSLAYHKVFTNNKVSGSYYDTSAYEIMLLLEDNFWRVRHKIRMNEQSGSNSQMKDVDAIEDFEISNNQLFHGNEHFLIRGINYYPENYSWTDMWEHYGDYALDEDLLKMKGLGFNSIRIFIPYELFGGPSVDKQHLDHLIKFLDLAQKNDLYVIITLFDFYLGYTLDNWTLADRHVEQLVKAIKDHPTLLAWDLKNEPDLDFDRYGKQDVLEWLNFIAQRVRSYDTKNLITIGWSQPELMPLLMEQLDFLSFHYYRNPDDLIPILNTLNINNKPLFLGETGMHSFSSWWYPFSKTEQDQATYISDITEVIASQKLSYAFWTLYDFSNVPPNVAGRWPWQKNPQGSYGLYKKDNKQKPSAELIERLNIEMKQVK